MTLPIKRNPKTRIGIIGCGSIGSRLACSIEKEMASFCRLNALHDILSEKAKRLEVKLMRKKIAKNSITDLIKSSDLVIEAIASSETQKILFDVVKAKKDLLVMSTGQLLNAPSLFRLARRNKCRILLPSGAICGVDALKAARQTGFDSIMLTTRKPLKGLSDSGFMKHKNIHPRTIRSETILFEGSVAEAVRLFPANINVAATIALATQTTSQLKVRIVTSPDFQTNSHEITARGSFGAINSRVENIPCPDNPRTSYLAVLSATQTLRDYFDVVKIGT